MAECLALYMRRHPGEGRGPASGARSWIPAFAGMTPEYMFGRLVGG